MKKDYLDKIYGCWLGKNMGGTLGMPFEGRQGFLNLNFYDPVPEHPTPNDDLDLQLVWLACMKEKGAKIDSKYLGKAWLDHIICNPDEYGVARWNLRRRIKPPLSGLHNNWFYRGMGGAIRSEIWACLFPGNPNTAAYYALQDAQVDHADEGVYAEIFLAASESIAFVEKKMPEIIQGGLNFLPNSSILKKAIQYTWKLYDSHLLYEEAREKVMKKYNNPNFTDCVMNLCFIILGLLYGEYDFEKSLLYAVNCGQDTDCTAATVGAFLGILKGKKGIPEKWSKPIGRDIKVGDYICDLSMPKNLDELSLQTYELAKNFEKEKLPSIQPPYTYSSPQEFSDKIPWQVNGKPMEFEGIHMKPMLPSDSAARVQFIEPVTNKLEMKTFVRIPADGEILVMVCSDNNIFDFYFDEKKIISWDKKEPIVPAFHRVKGGQAVKLEVEKNKPYEISFYSKDFNKDSQVTIAFADIKMNFLDIIYGTGK